MNARDGKDPTERVRGRGTSRLRRAPLAAALLALLALGGLFGAVAAAGAAGAPGKPTATAPGGAIATTTPSFTWSTASGAARYELRVHRGGEQALKETGLTELSWTSSAALPEIGDLAVGEACRGLAQGSVYYVAPDGDDAHDGRSVASPWRTIQKAAETLVAGDTVYVRAGTYRERVAPRESGAAGGLITYAAYPGEVVTIDGSGVDVPEYCGLFDLSGRDYVRVSGLRVIDSAYYGIVADTSSYITIDHNYTYNTYSSGISSWSSDHIIVDENEVVGACTGPWQEHISISDTDTFEVRYNRVHDVMPGTDGKEGMSIKDASRHGKVYGNRVHGLNHVGIYVDAEAEHLFDVAVYQNLVYDSESMGFSLAAEVGGLLEDVRLYNNIAYDNLCGLWFSDLGHPTFKDVEIVNNTFVGNGRDGWGVGIGIETQQFTNVLIRNNICSGNTYSQMSAPPSTLPQLTVDHNLSDGAHDPDYEIHGVDDLLDVSPLFADPSLGDFHLLAGSPAIDAGSAVDAPANDFAGDVRPQDGDGDGVAACDIGAYEWGGRVFAPLVTVATPAFPLGAGYPVHSTLTVSWTVSGAPAAGAFRIWARGGGDAWYRLSAPDVPASGAGAYGQAVTLDVAAGPGYQIVVAWSALGAAPWSGWGTSSGSFAVTPLFTTDVTAPTGAGSYAVGADLTVGWTVSGAPAAGAFRVWARAAAGAAWYELGDVPAVAGASSYSRALPLSGLLAGAGYEAIVAYSPTGAAPWNSWGTSPGSFAVTAR